MGLHLYTALKSWRQYRHDSKGGRIVAREPGQANATGTDTIAAAVFAAGIACAGQVPEQPNH